MDIKLIADKWVTNNKNINITNTDKGIKIEYFSDKVFDYIHYENIRYFTSYSEKDLFDIAKDTVYNIEFDGYIEGDCSCKLFINTYSKKKQLSNDSITLSSKEQIRTSKDVESYKIAIRVQGRGVIYINNLLLKKEYTIDKLNNLSIDKYLLITNIYPSQDNLYRNMFVHRRVKLYKEYGINVDVYSLDSKGVHLSKYKFEGIDVLKGSYGGLEEVLRKNKYKKILIHFVMKETIAVIDKICYNTPRIVWLHGFESMKWQRRVFNYTGEEILKNYAKWNENDKLKMNFLRSIYNDNRYTFVIVSNWLKSKCCEVDAQCNIKQSYVIPNVIDEKFFRYKEKHENDRLKILSVRPFTANNYANDLTVKAILELSKKEFFNKLEFNIYGKGKLFKEITKDISNFKNVNLHEKFMTQKEIADLHKEHGIFLCPSRLDTQGVSMCEAMSSGLVCISNDVAAISEYLIDKKCGLLAKENEYIGLANAIEYLYYNKNEFLKMSKNAARHIKHKCGIDSTVKKEIKLIVR